jgi:large subunit ribosomal protein L9
MKVMFLEDVPGVADAGQIKQVKNGFARNYLIPKKLAAPAVADQIQRIAKIEQAAAERRLREAKDLDGLAGKLKETTITLERKMGPTGKLYGAVTSRHIAEEISSRIERAVDHRTVLLPHAIHEPGNYSVTLRLHRNVSVDMTVVVVAEGHILQQNTQVKDLYSAQDISEETLEETMSDDLQEEDIGSEQKTEED